MSFYDITLLFKILSKFAKKKGPIFSPISEL